MAIIHLTFQQLLYLLRVFGTITNTWPPHPNIGKYELFFRNLYCCVITFTFVVVWVEILMNLFKNLNSDVGELMKNIFHMTCSVESILNLILCTVQRKQLQSTQLSWSVYGASYTTKMQKIKNNISIMLQRSQQLLLISMGSFLPALTLEYYGDFVTKVLSYFMTMRVVIAA